MAALSESPNVVYLSSRQLDKERSSNGLDDNVSVAQKNVETGAEKDEMASTHLTDSQQETPVIDIVISNVVCSFNVRCHLNLRQIALTAANVEYRRESGLLTMKIRKPYTTASIWSSGKVTCTGSTSEEMAKLAARKFARVLQTMGFKVRFTNYRVVNVLGTCTMPFGIRLNQFSRTHPKQASYEPELHPGVTYKIPEIKATLKIFSTGSITVTAPRVSNVQLAIEHIFPLVHEFRNERIVTEDSRLRPNAHLQSRRGGRCKRSIHQEYSTSEEEDDEEEEEEEMSDDCDIGSRSWD